MYVTVRQRTRPRRGAVLQEHGHALQLATAPAEVRQPDIIHATCVSVPLFCMAKPHRKNCARCLGAGPTGCSIGT